MRGEVLKNTKCSGGGLELPSRTRCLLLAPYLFVSPSKTNRRATDLPAKRSVNAVRSVKRERFILRARRELASGICEARGEERHMLGTGRCKWHASVARGVGNAGRCKTVQSERASAKRTSESAWIWRGEGRRSGFRSDVWSFTESATLGFEVGQRSWVWWIIDWEGLDLIVYKTLVP